MRETRPHVQSDSNDAWDQHVTRFRNLFRQRGSVSDRDIAVELRWLIQEAASSIAVPTGLPQAEVHPWLNVGTPRAEWAGGTSPHLAFCYPNNCWRWLLFNQNTIGTTLAWTQQAILHELLHATDVWRAAQEYKRLHGNPPPNTQQNRCIPVQIGVREGWQDRWGKYVNNFISFYEGGLTAIRHEEIYGAATESYFERMNIEEKLIWFEGALDNIPPNLPATQSFKVEQIILRLFRKPIPQQQRLRNDLATKLVRTTFNFIDGNTSDLGKAVSLLRHFDLVWQTRREERAIILRGLRRNIEQIQSSNPSSRTHQPVIQRQDEPQIRRSRDIPIVENAEIENKMLCGHDRSFYGLHAIDYTRNWAHDHSSGDAQIAPPAPLNMVKHSCQDSLTNLKLQRNIGNYAVAHLIQRAKNKPKKRTRYIVPGMKLIQQTTTMGCWYASAQMLIHWRRGRVKVSETHVIDPSEDIISAAVLAANTGISDTQIVGLAQRLGLKLIPPMSPTPELIEQWLRTYGPLWTNGSTHITVIAGINDNRLLVYDPARSAPNWRPISWYIGTAVDSRDVNTTSGVFMHLPGEF